MTTPEGRTIDQESVASVSAVTNVESTAIGGGKRLRPMLLLPPPKS
jgi:hypothetical protein